MAVAGFRNQPLLDRRRFVVDIDPDGEGEALRKALSEGLCIAGQRVELQRVDPDPPKPEESGIRSVTAAALGLDELIARDLSFLLMTGPPDEVVPLLVDHPGQLADRLRRGHHDAFEKFVERFSRDGRFRETIELRLEMAIRQFERCLGRKELGYFGDVALSDPATIEVFLVILLAATSFGWCKAPGFDPRHARILVRLRELATSSLRLRLAILDHRGGTGRQADPAAIRRVLTYGIGLDLDEAGKKKGLPDDWWADPSWPFTHSWPCATCHTNNLVPYIACRACDEPSRAGDGRSGPTVWDVHVRAAAAEHGAALRIGGGAVGDLVRDRWVMLVEELLGALPNAALFVRRWKAMTGAARTETTDPTDASFEHFCDDVRHVASRSDLRPH
ncbi:MAG: hypothetical protein HYY06_11460 [Deltaproteobacteria bacterium]|nr:hypothetical protein [Deltaproteobacteria bacterium]